MLWKLLLLLLLAGARATYPLGPGDPRLLAAQSHAQTRNNGRPPLRTLNPASKVTGPAVTLDLGELALFREINSFICNSFFFFVFFFKLDFTLRYFEKNKTKQPDETF